MSKEITLTQDKMAVVDDADFEWLNQWKWYAVKDKNTWYGIRAACKDDKKTTIKMHREILKPPSSMETDHKDGNGLNNQRSNLRIATHAQNAYNQRKRQGTSRFKGVCWNRREGKWIARVQMEGNRLCLGYFLSETDAAKAYDFAAKKFYGQFANVNFK